MSRQVLSLLIVLGLSGTAMAEDAVAEVVQAATATAPAEPSDSARVVSVYKATLGRYLDAAEQARIEGFEANAAVGSERAAFASVDNALRVVAPLALSSQGFESAARRLRNLSPIVDAPSARRAYETATDLYPEIPFRSSTGLSVSQSESAVLAAISSARTVASTDASDEDESPVRAPMGRIRYEMAAGQAARAAGHALRATSNRAAALDSIVAFLETISAPRPATSGASAPVALAKR